MQPLVAWLLLVLSWVSLDPLPVNATVIVIEDKGVVPAVRTVLGPLYRLFWYFSASLMHEVWPLYSPGVLKVVEQSIQS